MITSNKLACNKLVADLANYLISYIYIYIYIYIGREVYIIFLPIYITPDYSLAKSVINLLQPIQGVYMSNNYPPN